MPKMIDEDECPKGLPGWLATFGDLMSLLLTFFVLLLSFASMEEIKFHHAMGSLRHSLGIFESEPEMSQPIRITMPPLCRSIRKSAARIRALSAWATRSVIEPSGRPGQVRARSFSSFVASGRWLSPSRSRARGAHSESPNFSRNSRSLLRASTAFPVRRWHTPRW